MEANELTTHLINPEAEIQILGSIFLKNELMDELFIKEEYFYDSRHKKILWLMNEMRQKEMDIDAFTLLTLAAEYRLVEDIGGMKYLTETVHVPSASNFKYYQNTVLELYKKREQVKIAKTILNSLLDENSAEVASKASNSLVELTALGEQESTVKHIGDIMTDIYGNLVDDNQSNKPSKTHFSDLDRVMGGLRKQDFVIIGARPSMGKTAFAMNIAQQHAVKNAGVVLVFSIEMPNDGIGQRIMSSETLIDSKKFKEPGMRLTQDDWTKVMMSIGQMSETKMYMTDESSVTIDYIRRESKKLAAKYPDEHMVILIDYLQLIQGSKKHGGNRTAEISEISRELKRIARETNATMIALSQLSRGVEQRQDKRPMMSDLRESGQIEQD